MSRKNEVVVEPRLLRVRDAAALLSVSERTVWHLIRSGDLIAIHPPGLRAIRIARDDVEKLIGRWQYRHESTDSVSS
jgi:excisionase family DNA binding protein